MPRLRLLTAAAFVLASGGAISCAAILGFERLSEEGGLVIDSGADALDDSSIPVPVPEAGSDAGSDTGCGQIGIPDPPLDASQTVGPQLLFALEGLDFGAPTDGGRADVPGYNLDRACSTNVATSTCSTSLAETTFDDGAKDKSPAGLDNAGITLIEFISTAAPTVTFLNAATLNLSIQQGRFGAVIRLTNWNGAPDDDDVLVEIFPAIGIVPNNGQAVPHFTPNDLWIPDSRFQIAPGFPASDIKSDEGWVTGGQLVARFQSVTVPIIIDVDPKPFDIRLNDAIVSGTLTTTNGQTALSAGTIAGRWKTSDFLGQVRTLFVKSDLAYVCDALENEERTYLGAKFEVCNVRDIRADSKDSMNLPCDAMSAAIRIQTYSVNQLGPFQAGPVLPPRCVDAAVPLGDDCSP